MLNTPYGTITAQQHQQLVHTKLLICDIDGVFSDGRIYMGNNGEELKAFHTRDGFGIKAVLHAGIEVAVITGRKSTIVNNRMSALGVSHIFQGQDNKLIAFQQLLTQLNLNPDEVAYIGDDVIDLPVMNQVGLAVAVADAHPIVQQQAHYVTTIKGGFGAVRELCDLLLHVRGELAHAQGTSV
ncbi:3-deoxy-manno-octulosonate-8-phosphatase KdsC [Motilimonas cestriensis]|uniref:3-deoxy-D-manno-octulosonate 8-phosphate phosphatase KdsC n=1 Tax=Motilimonas cestriensis TaxID=2742685 RepID=A0ABS8WC43_9GAMM|nr:3-deoxy-manno-octulosonate-8-phosphatase KdsC [Motilimonas cestriensis]MCE2596065.1 3-deoxy-manno-octulosonate-8-phosphatase KdsC [Motilimonas cestriensis]